MAEGILRPTVAEPYAKWSARLAAASPGPTKHEAAKAFAEYLEEEWHRLHVGRTPNPADAFQVLTRGEAIVVRCLVDRAHGWKLLQKAAKAGFAGRAVIIEKAWHGA